MEDYCRKRQTNQDLVDLGCELEAIEANILVQYPDIFEKYVSKSLRKAIRWLHRSGGDGLDRPLKLFSYYALWLPLNDWRVASDYGSCVWCNRVAKWWGKKSWKQNEWTKLTTSVERILACDFFSTVLSLLACVLRECASGRYLSWCLKKIIFSGLTQEQNFWK